jgi:hypothetical protein
MRRGASSMRFSRRQGFTGHRHYRLTAVALTVVSICGGLLVGSTDAGASSGPKGSVTVGSKTYKFSGGSCLGNGSHVQTVLFNGGNSLTVTGKLHHGKFKDAIAGLTIKGKATIVIDPDSGTSSSKGGTIKGTDLGGPPKVTGKWSC